MIELYNSGDVVDTIDGRRGVIIDNDGGICTIIFNTDPLIVDEYDELDLSHVY